MKSSCRQSEQLDRKPCRHHWLVYHTQKGFTLVEMLVACLIIAMLLSVAVPGLRGFMRSGGITNATNAISDALAFARAYAMTRNTYVWVGFYEEDVTADQPTDYKPPYIGRGRVVLGMVASNDGTRIFENGDPIAVLPTERIHQIGKLIKLERIHIVDIGPPSGGDRNSLDGRPSKAYTLPGPPYDHFNRISSESDDATRFPFLVQGYSFYKTLRFSPQGTVNINSTYEHKRMAEIGLRPNGENSDDVKNSDIAAIQVSGIGGCIKTYRK